MYQARYMTYTYLNTRLTFEFAEAVPRIRLHDFVDRNQPNNVSRLASIEKCAISVEGASRAAVSVWMPRIDLE